MNDLTTCSCGECGGEFSPEAARKKLVEQARRWSAVCAWIGLAGEVMGDAETEAE